MICQTIAEGEQFWCAGNLYRMLIPRDATQSFEAVLETIAPGIVTPPNTRISLKCVSSFRERHRSGSVAKPKKHRGRR